VDAGFFVVVAVVAALVAVGGWWFERHRRRLVAHLCQDRGWIFRPKADDLVSMLGADFPLLRMGRGRRGRNAVLASGRDRAVTLFDYAYVEQHGTPGQPRSSSRTVRWAIGFAELPQWLPSLRLGPETLLTRVGRALGAGDIDVESPEFNRRFRVRARDRAHAFDLLHPRAIEHLLRQPYDVWEVAGARVLIARRGTWRPDEYGPAVANLEAFIATIPDYVWSKHRERGA
jgi:hypothetical protein